MVDDWLWTTWQEAGLVVLSALVLYPTVIVLTRLNGLRSFAKLSAFDFAMTVAIGTMFSSAIATGRPPVAQAIVALLVLYGLQRAVARGRIRWPGLERLVDNTPLMLFEDGEVLEENLRGARVAEAEPWAAVRRARVTDVRSVRAVVLETTGDISVMVSDTEGGSLDDRLLTGVRR